LLLLRVSRRSRHSHDDYRSSRFPHHTLLRSAMRLQRRPSAAPRCSRGRSWGTVPGRPPRPFTRRVHRRGFASAPRAAAGGPEQAGGPGEDQQHDDNGHDPRTTRGLSRGFLPPLRSLLRPARLRRPRRLQLRRAHCGRAAGRRARGCAAAHHRWYRATSRNGGPLPPFTRIPARSLRPG
jgi:hypothetical protein